jgi:hypothetical protein
VVGVDLVEVLARAGSHLGASHYAVAVSIEVRQPFVSTMGEREARSRKQGKS